MKINIEYKECRFSWDSSNDACLNILRISQYEDSLCVGQINEDDANRAIFEALRTIAKEIEEKKQQCQEKQHHSPG